MIHNQLKHLFNLLKELSPSYQIEAYYYPFCIVPNEIKIHGIPTHEQGLAIMTKFNCPVTYVKEPREDFHVLEGKIDNHTTLQVFIDTPAPKTSMEEVGG